DAVATDTPARWATSVMDAIERCDRRSVGIRIRTRVVADGHPLPLGELVPIGRAAEPRTIPGGAHPAERDRRLVVHGLIVHVNHAALEPLGERPTARDHPGLDGA